MQGFGFGAALPAAFKWGAIAFVASQFFTHADRWVATIAG